MRSIFIWTTLTLGAVLLAPAFAELPELIPIDVLFGNPSKLQARISPDGTRLSYLAPSEEGVMNVWVRTLGEEDDTLVTHDKERGVREHFWAKNGRQLLYLQDISGDENWHVYAADLETGVVRDLTPFQGIMAVNPILDHNHPEAMLIGLNLRDRSLFDMYRVDLRTGAITLEAENPGDVVDWITDPDFLIRGAWSVSSEDGSQTLRVRDGRDGEWRDLVHFPFGEQGAPVDFSADGESLILESSLGSDTTRLVRVALGTGEVQEVLAHDERCDIGRVVVNPKSHQVQAVEANYLTSEWKVLDSDVEADFAALDEAFRGNFGIAARDLADRTWIVYHEIDDGPLTYHAYDRATKGLERLFSHRPELDQYQLAERRPVVIEARDGLKMVSYLTLPLGLDAKNLPLVLIPHGGPWDRDTWGYNSWAQWFANRGYAVLQPNFRASTGFGKSFLNAGNREWGGLMQHDLTDSVKWAADHGIADPEKIAIFGASYGGYATLVGLAFTPELYACGVDIVGLSNMKTLFESIPPYWEPYLKELVLRIGDVLNDEDLNRRISPLFHVDKISVPLLIGQGANDPRVNIAESDQIVEAMRGKELPVIYVVYTDEGHGFARPENRLDFFGRADEFVADCLGGRSQVFREVEGSSAELR